MTTYTPTEPKFDFAPNPGRILQRELAHASMSQAELAARTGLSPKHINLVVKGSAPISAEVAVSLEEILGTPAEMWLRLEAGAQVRAARADKQNALAGFVEWAGSFPRSILIEKEVIEPSDRGTALVSRLLAFFGVASPKAYEKTWLEPQASYKRSQLHAIDKNLTALWLRLAEREAADLLSQAPPYDANQLREAAIEIPRLTVGAIGKAFEQAQQRLLSAGVVLVVLDEMQGTRISGVSRWIDGTPLIAVTIRYKAPDSLWFSILHEIAHVLLHPKRSTFVDDEGAKARDDSDTQESAANAFAQDLLIPPAYRARLDAITSASGIRELAAELGISPSLVAGQWCFRTKTWNGPIAALRKQGTLKLT